MDESRAVRMANSMSAEAVFGAQTSLVSLVQFKKATRAGGTLPKKAFPEHRFE